MALVGRDLKIIELQQFCRGLGCQLFSFNFQVLDSNIQGKKKKKRKSICNSFRFSGRPLGTFCCVKHYTTFIVSSAGLIWFYVLSVDVFLYDEEPLSCLHIPPVLPYSSDYLIKLKILLYDLSIYDCRKGLKERFC